MTEEIIFPKYPKIETLFNRDDKTFKVIPGEWRTPEFEYLARNKWCFTEKVDGTNIRIGWAPGKPLSFRGRTDAAQIPPFLSEYLGQTFTADRFREIFCADEGQPPSVVVLYGEGYGNRIQKVGRLYKLTETGFKK